MTCSGRARKSSVEKVEFDLDIEKWVGFQQVDIRTKGKARLGE